MPVVCPDLAAYRRLASGQTSEVEQESLLQHLESCEACGQQLSGARISDTLTELVRSARRSGEDVLAENLVRVMERLTRIPPRPIAVSEGDRTMALPDFTEDEAAAAENSQTPNLAEARTEEGSHLAVSSGETVDSEERLNPEQLCGFLAKPESADELGRLGGYRVLRMLGAGGMGVVFLAEDPRLRRRVALKAMLPSVATTTTAKQRFLREAQAAAAIKHDHIVTIYQVDEDRGAPFLAMELLEGESLDQRLKREGKLPVTEVLRIGAEIAEGLAAAHAGGLIHRDIKPANIWLEGKKGRVKILDFGLARAAEEQQQLTQSGAIVGTPGYMSPEQASGETIGAGSDLFSLGCVLYQLLTGQSPFQRANSMQTLFAIAFEEPKGVRDLQPQVPKALADLTMRLLAKKPENRPASSAAVAEQLRALVAGPERAGKESAEATELLPAAKTLPAHSRRNRRRVILAGIPALAFLAAAVVAAVLILRVETPDGTIIVQIPDGEAENVQLSVKKGGREIELVDVKSRKEIKLPVGAYQLDLVGGKEGLRLESTQYELKSGDRRIAKVIFEPPVKPPVANPIPPVANPFSLDQLDPGKVPAEERVVGMSGEFVNAMSGEIVAVLGESRRRDRGPVETVALHPEGRLLASCGPEGVSVWDLQTGVKAFRNRVGGHPRGCAFSPDGKVLAAGSDNGIQRWQLPGWQALPELLDKVGSGLKFSPDGLLLATAGGAARSVTVWETRSGKQVVHLDNRAPPVSCLDFSPDGKVLAYASKVKGGVELYDLSANRPLTLLEEPPATRDRAGYELKSISFMHDGTVLAIGSVVGDGEAVVRFVKVADHAEVASVRLASGDVRVACSPVSKLVALGVDDGAIRLWDVTAGKEVRRLEGHTSQPVDLAFSRDGTLLASAGGFDQTTRLWDVATGKEKYPLGPGSTGQVIDQGFTSDGSQLVAVSTDNMVRTWDLATQRMTSQFYGGVARGTLVPHAVWGSKQANSTCALDREAKTLAIARGKVWDLAGHKELLSIRGYWSVALTPDGKVLAGVKRGSPEIEFVNLKTGDKLPSLRSGKEVWGVLTFSPDGKVLAYWSDGHIILAEWAQGKQLAALPYEGQPSFQPVCFSSNGRLLVDLRIRVGDHLGGALWDMETARTTQPFEMPYGTQPVVSADGSLLAVLTFGGTGLQLFQLPTGKVLREWRGMQDCSHIAFAPDSRHLALGARNGTIRILRLGAEFHPALPH